ncbi:MAG: DUF4359 domain-containing protein [Trueperaceae bacterium]|nr:DUF4359 domain-containing protein [Trueperaceae bacterium]
MRNFILGIVFALVVGGLYLSNPTKEQFSRQYADKVNADLAKSLGLEDIGGPVGDFIGGLSQNVIEEALKAQVREENYLLASVFTLPTTGEDVRVLGIAGQFVTLN